MTTFPIIPNQAPVKAAPYQYINASIRTLAIEIAANNNVLPGEENPDTPIGRIERLVKLYEALKPLLQTVAALTLIPRGWRSALSLFLAALEAVADGLADLSAQFKAGKDL